MLICICVIDGQGGGIGAAIIKRLKAEFVEHVEIIALGTNEIATAQMLKAGANKGGDETCVKPMHIGSRMAKRR